MQGNFDSSTPGTPAVIAAGTKGADGAHLTSDTGTAVLATGRFGVVGGSHLGIAVTGNATGGGSIGVRATSDVSWAINAQSTSGIGILGASDSNIGVQGICQTGYNFGVVGTGPNAGVVAFNPNNTHAAYLASDSSAGWFTGPVTVTGHLYKSGGGFRIDHPVDPHGKYLSHSFVESPDMKNVYDGIVVADAQGGATVELPGWFEALNHDFRYQLTPVNAAAPDLHVSREMENNCFQIGGAKPEMKVCWQVTGIRQDPWANANRIVAEEQKPAGELGHFLHPTLYSAPPEQSVGLARHRQK